MSTISAVSPAVTRQLSTLELPRPKGPTRLQILARSLLLLALFAAPWAYGAVLPWGWAGLTILACLTLLVWVLAGLQRGGITLVGSPLYWPFLGFLVVASLQLSLGLTYDRLATREALVKIATDLLLFFLAGQLFNTEAYVGFSHPTYGELTAGRQNSLITDGLGRFDPMGAAPDFSVIGVSNTAAGGGDTQTARFNTSLQYRVGVAS